MFVLLASAFVMYIISKATFGSINQGLEQSGDEPPLWLALVSLAVAVTCLVSLIVGLGLSAYAIVNFILERING